MSFATTDISDAHPATQVAAPIFQHFGGVQQFSGPVKIIKVFEDNSLVRDMLEQAGEGRVLVVDGGASMRCALVGGNLGQLGVDNGWSGIVVYGCIRDRAELGAQQIGVMALASHPKKSVKRGVGEQDLEVSFADMRIAPSDWVYADADGIVVSSAQITAV